jgi:4-amino-4-deoxy-L-arabinose transferase-like glycosyltransferase
MYYSLMSLKSKLTYFFLLFGFLVFIFPSFFYKLGDSSLYSFDEAWYGTIAKNISITHDPLNLYFNGGRFADHPPTGFWFIALTQNIFGPNEFGTRAAAALFGLACLALIFILGSQIASPAVGLASAMGLASAPWFLYRARSGNLDITLTFFFLLTFVLAFCAIKNKKYFFPLSVSLALLIQTKTLVPFTIIPSIVLLFWNLNIFILLTLTVTLTLPWLISQLIHYPGFFSKYIGIGLPKSEKITSLWQNILQTKTYLHSGIGTLFRPIVIILPFSIFYKSKSNFKFLLSIIIFCCFFLTPFVFSSRGQIWHLIPVFPFLILLFFYILFSILNSYFINHKSLISSVIITLSIFISVPQISKNWHEFVDIPAFVSDQAILSRKASAYPEPLYIDDRFLPVAVFYSGKIVNDLPTPDFSAYFNKSNSILLITHRWRLDQNPQFQNRYQILASDRDLVLIRINSPLTPPLD